MTDVSVKRAVKVTALRSAGLPRWLVPTIAALALTIVAAVSAGVLYQSRAAAKDRRNFPPPGRLVSVGGLRMHLVVSGKRHGQEPTVVLETGLGSMSSAWGWVQPEVAKFARVVSYDRAGLGWSEADPQPPSGERAARRLHDLLQASGIEGPYLLVGHSMGGLLVRLFNDFYPEEVAGIVLLDPCHPDQQLRSRALREHMAAGFRMLKTVPLLARIGFVRATDYLDEQSRGLPPKQVAEARVFLCSYDHLKTTNDDAANWDCLCAQVRRTRKLEGKPLTVLTAGRGMKAGALELQQELARLSSRGKQLVVQGADHVTLVTHREHALTVVAEIRRMYRLLAHSSKAPAAETLLARLAARS